MLAVQVEPESPQQRLAAARERLATAKAAYDRIAELRRNRIEGAPNAIDLCDALCKFHCAAEIVLRLERLVGGDQ